MNSQTLAVSTSRWAWTARVRDYIELTKPRIAALELATVAAVAFFAAGGPIPPARLAITLLGTLFVAGSASALNQLLESQSDARMPRTAQRPLPQARLRRSEVLTFGAATVVVGTLVLLAAVNALTAALGLLTWALYVAVYTPLKRVSPINTTVGAVAGALPVLMGWASVGRPFDLDAATLFVVLFLWQFPHFMAIAWLYRRDYAAADMKMLTTIDPTGRRAGAQAFVAALMLVPVSLIPAIRLIEPTFFAAALILGLAQLIAAAQFLFRLDDRSARRLLTATLIYLPTLWLLLLLTPVI